MQIEIAVLDTSPPTVNLLSICRMAIKYIKHLQYLLSYPPHQKIPSHIVEFDPAHPAWVKAGIGHHHMAPPPPPPHFSEQDLGGHAQYAILDLDDGMGEENSNEEATPSNSDNIWMSNTALPTPPTSIAAASGPPSSSPASPTASSQSGVA